MHIQEYETYCAAEVLPLYSSVGWTAYTAEPETLRRGFARSLLTLAAYADGRLIGLLRAVGDGETVVFVQDLLVCPAHQRRGVGTALLRELLARYPEVRQIELAADDTPKTRAFYCAPDSGLSPKTAAAATGGCGTKKMPPYGIAIRRFCMGKWDQSRSLRSVLSKIMLPWRSCMCPFPASRARVYMA